MATLNTCNFIGRLGRDPEMSYTPNGTALTKCSIAVNRRKDAQGNEQPPIWINLIIWQKLAEIVNQYAKKGTEVFVQGEINPRTYQDRTGVERTALDLTVSTFQLLGPKPKEHTAHGVGELGDLSDHPF